MSLTPEEWVRQHIIHYLINDKNYPISLIAIEKKLIINKLSKRTDILVFTSKGTPNIIVECKAPSVKINQNSFDQIARYNLKLAANYLIVSNGLNHYFCFMDVEKEQYVFLENIPHYISD
ncbi:type I restriction enzyme HsdR N-terminal domain-containing protein [Lutibacter aestuarii]|uniref:Type I restriction enzyme HsdR N-terminal domain-containing protein n=1 Tax=Lutibacter aestuarii TaxID=861111 RepID=A0ABW2Z8Z1_9FLAO